MVFLYYFSHLFRTFASVRRKTLIFLSLFVIIFVMAEVPRLGFIQSTIEEDSVVVDSALTDSVVVDSFPVDKRIIHCKRQCGCAIKPLTTLWLPTL